ncbi:hypothetical protein UFOVP116_291 [uncultured Caudovirales phage]|uniref:Uncharacterized protein n=1 Tax=uncultured Caudovirales phage TaxID=2100421 RepID=A0A6J5LA22_9CAUD|nr:hypothetical protein UFOVP116_291 [uncultured Caudovirales phage]
MSIERVKLCNGTIEYYSNGELHRLDGPAIENANGTGEWFIAGNQYFSPVEFCKVAKIVGKQRTLFLLKHSF